MLKSATGQGLVVKCENVGVGERVSDGKSEHIAYTFELSVGSGVVGTFATRYSHGLEAHAQFVQQGYLNHLDPPLEFPPKYWFRNMITVRLFVHCLYCLMSTAIRRCAGPHRVFYHYCCSSLARG